MPALRNRPHDLERHAWDFLRFFAEESGGNVKIFSPDAWAAVRRHAWPGNLRELRNSIERAVILARGEVVELEDLPSELAVPANGGPEVALGALVESTLPAAVLSRL